MENGGVITLELYPDAAPKTVANFEKLVKSGYISPSNIRIYDTGRRPDRNRYGRL